MSWKLSRSRRLIVALLCAGIVSGAAYSYTASNTVPATGAGFGNGTISGYTISGLGYTLNSTDPSLVDAVAFTISPTNAGSVYAQLAAGGPWYSCANVGGSVTCATTSPQGTATGSTQLTVVSVQ